MTMSKIIPFSDLGAALDYYYDRPVEFCQDILHLEPDKWQEDVLNDLAKHPKVSVRSGQGVGKTALEAGAILWFLTCRPYPKVIATAPTMKQLYDVLWAEVAKWLNDSLIKDLLRWTKTKVYMVGDSERWFATARTATKPENMQGFHEDHMLIVVDEASGVSDVIMEAILGTLSGFDNKLLLCGNPNNIEGVFFDSHNRDRDKYKTHKVSSYDSKRTNKDNIQMIIDKYGDDSDVARVRIYGEFPRSASDSLISLESVENATKSKIDVALVNIAIKANIGVDVARFGDDSTVLTSMIANKVQAIERYRKQDTMATSGNVVKMAQQLMDDFPNLKTITIKVDDTGVGGGVTDRLKEVIREQRLPFTVVPVNNGSSSSDKYYHNVGSEQWGILKDLLEKNISATIQGEVAVIELPNNDTLIKELSTRKYKISSSGRIQLERKEDMKKRGLTSPDIADSVALAFYEPPVAKATTASKSKYGL